MNRKPRRHRCDELLEQFGITKLRKSKAIVALRRRAAAAGDRPLPGVSSPQIILLDEPFTGIDPVTIDEHPGHHPRPARRAAFRS